MSLGVAVSGGGHRATAWAFGALAALVESGANKQVVSVSSVSGGSIANGVVARAGDYTEQTPGRFRQAITPALRVVATDGIFLTGPLTNLYLRVTFGLIGTTISGLLAFLAASLAAGRGAESHWVVAVAGVIAGGYVGWKLGGLLRLSGLVVALVDGAATGAMVWLAATLTSDLHGLSLWSALLGFGVGWFLLAWLTMWRFSRRGSAVRRALEAGLLVDPNDKKKATMLADVNSSVNHVICATDLQAGGQFYFTPEFIYGYREGWSTSAPAGLTLATAVQASAGFPGGFPPSRVTTPGFERDQNIKIPAAPPDHVVLSDGGVYDNMGDEWELGLTERLLYCQPLTNVQSTPADVLVVANASPMWDWSPFGGFGLIRREITALLRVEDVQYNVSTSRRRNQLVQLFTASGGVTPGKGGVIVMIDRVPMRLALPFTRSKDPRVAARAERAVEFLNSMNTDWEAIATRNSAVATTLGPIGTSATLDLMDHAYTSTMVGLYVLHGIGELKPFPRSDYLSAING